MRAPTTIHVRKKEAAAKPPSFTMTALRFAPLLFLGPVCLWSATGLVALDFADIVPSSLSPFLQYVRSPVQIATKGALVSAAPFTHLIGCLAVEGYRAYAPFKGGDRFVKMQTGGWCVYGVGLILILLDLAHNLGFGICITCAPGFLITTAVAMALGNSLLISSLYSHEKEQPQTKRKHKNKHTRNGSTLVSDCLTIAVGVAGVFTLVLKAHPHLAVGKVSRTFFEGFELPFCEVPYMFSKYVAQFPSFLLHLPYVPVVLLSLYLAKIGGAGRTVRGPEQVQVMVGLLVFQAWTGVGHVVRNPRRLFVEEISIALFLVVARAFANAMTKEDKDKISALALGKASVFMLTAYTVFGLMPMIVMGAVYCCGVLGVVALGDRESTAAAVNTTTTNGKNKNKNNGFLGRHAAGLVRMGRETSLLSEMTGPGRLALGALLGGSVALLTLEVRFCRKLLAFDDTLSWHAPFDLVFWQGFWVLVQVVALAKPGSCWKKKASTAAAPPTTSTTATAIDDTAAGGAANDVVVDSKAAAAGAVPAVA